LWVLGLGERVGDLADSGADAIGRALAEEQLPKRVRLPRRRPVGGGR